MSWQDELGELPILRLPSADTGFLARAEQAYEELSGLPRVARAWGWLMRLEELDPDAGAALAGQRAAQGGSRLVRRLMALEGLLQALSPGLHRPPGFVRLALAVGPEQEMRDGEGRLHSLHGPARGYEYWVCGEQVDPVWVLAPQRKTLQELTRLRSLPARRTLLPRMGHARAVETGWARVVDLDRDATGHRRRLLNLDLPEDEPLVLVEVRCTSTHRLHYLRVPPGTRSCAEAVAWTFGLERDAYRPVAEV
ncbi:hypothetical protein DYH09_32365 [bacterium CPR1]|nr:hypothetical protein [bacterium CPR1]